MLSLTMALYNSPSRSCFLSVFGVRLLCIYARPQYQCFRSQWHSTILLHDRASCPSLVCGCYAFTQDHNTNAFAHNGTLQFSFTIVLLVRLWCAVAMHLRKTTIPMLSLTMALYNSPSRSCFLSVFGVR